MSFCSRLIYFNQNKSLPKYRKANCCKKAFLHIRSKGSYTLEMAVVLPLVTAFMVSILFFFRVLQVQTQVQEALVYASRQTAAQASIGDSSAALLRLLKCNSVKNCSSIKNIDIMYQRVLVEYPFFYQISKDQRLRLEQITILSFRSLFLK